MRKYTVLILNKTTWLHSGYTTITYIPFVAKYKKIFPKEDFRGFWICYSPWNSASNDTKCSLVPFSSQDFYSTARLSPLFERTVFGGLRLGDHESTMVKVFIGNSAFNLQGSWMYSVIKGSEVPLYMQKVYIYSTKRTINLRL